MDAENIDLKYVRDIYETQFIQKTVLANHTYPTKHL